MSEASHDELSFYNKVTIIEKSFELSYSNGVKELRAQPHSEPSVDWLKDQIRKLQMLTYSDATGSIWPYVETFERHGDAIDMAEMPQVVLAAVDSISDGTRTIMFRHVVFEEGDIAYVGPAYYQQGGKPMDRPIGADYRAVSKRLRWLDGISELALSVSAHASSKEEAQIGDFGFAADRLGQATQPAPGLHVS